MEWLFILVVLGILGALARLVFPLIVVFAAWKHWQRMQEAIAAQQALLAQGTVTLADPAAQDQFVAALRDAGSAAGALKGIQALQAQQQLVAVLAQLGQAQPGAHWANGAYFEHGNAVIPGGPSLINGQLFIPR